MIDQSQLYTTLEHLKAGLFEDYTSRGHWNGNLSSSALSTATAVFALYGFAPDRYGSLIDSGLEWLTKNSNPDGGWGDTVKSKSNISTTILCWAALHTARPAQYQAHIRAAGQWLKNKAGSLEPHDLIRTIDEKYQDDKTFSVPILTMCALAGVLGGEDANPWQFIKPLPFELAVLPRRLFRFLPLSVVSYALPALIAMGLVNYQNNRAIHPAVKLIKSAAKNKALNVLRQIQPAGGGFLEAPPLTSFVVMSLIGAGYRNDPVVKNGVGFLIASARSDGSWPIDTHLATWITTLSVNALAFDPKFPSQIGFDPDKTLTWLSNQQYLTRHKYTDAPPGGWAWTDRPGGVPDADDTAGALIALSHLAPRNPDTIKSATAGVNWLLQLQNSDGGIPTFCKGWTDMPFDRSGPDLTAHAVAAMRKSLRFADSKLRKKIARSTHKALDYLASEQYPDGSWVPLWFGHEEAPNSVNKLYGTARVIIGIAETHRGADMVAGAVDWIIANQNKDGSWAAAKGLPPTIEETALGLDALITVLISNCRTDPDKKPPIHLAINKAANWLIEKTDMGRSIPPAPIGLYFAGLWYFEQLYPTVFTIAALQKLQRLTMPAC